MILQYSVENYLSINKKQKIVFVNYENRKEKIESFIKSNDYDILSTMGIYGKNASGKTNMLKTLAHIKDMIVYSYKFNPAEAIKSYNVFEFTEEKNKDSSFEIMFIVNAEKYVYGFSHNSQKISEEYLYIFKTSKASKIFERKGKEYSYGKDYKSMKDIEDRTHDNKLFLSVCSQWAANIKEINDIYNYFKNDIFYYRNDINQPNPNFFKRTNDLVFEKKEAQEFLKKIIKYFDLELNDIKPVRNIMDINSIPDEVKLFIKSQNNLLNENSQIIQENIVSKYNINGKEYSLEFNLESNGVKKIYSMFYILFECLNNKKVLVIDEIEMGLHPTITKGLIGLFQNKEINKFGSQLFFSTHDSNILDLDFLRRDQIWFAVKELQSNYSTEVYSLADIKGVRLSDNISRDYLLGRYTPSPEIEWRDNDE